MFHPALLLSTILILSPLASALRAETLYLTVTADLHGRVGTADQGGAPRLATFLQDLRRRALQEQAPLLQLHAGDLYQGTAAVNGSQGRCMLPVLEGLDFHFGIPGNHEWDYGAEGFERLVALPRPLMLSTSIEGIDPRVYQRLVYQLGPHRIGFLGYTLPDTWRRAPPGSTDGLTFHSGDLLAREAAALRSRGVDVLVLVSHSDRAEVERLGEEIGFDLVLGAHTNEIIPLKRIGPDGPWYHQPGCHLEAAGWLRLEIDAGGRLAEVEADVVPLGDWPADPEVEAMVEPFVAPYRDRLERLVTTLSRPLYMGPWGGLSTLVSVGAQALRERAGTPFGLLNVKATRSHVFGPGEVRGQNLYEAFPYQNRIAVVELTGAQLDALFEANTASPFRDPREGERWSGKMSTDSRGVLQPAGFTVELDPGRPPGDRVRILDAEGAVLPEDERFRVATSDFLAGGGDGHEILRDAPRELREDTVLEAITERFASRGDQAPCGPGGLRNLTHETSDLSCGALP